MCVFFRNIAVLSAILILFAACYSVPDEISPDLSAPELIQRAQEASERNRYNVAVKYYDTVLERFYYDMEYVCAAEYELAFIKYKQKNYEGAKEGFNNLLSRYDSPDAELFPQQYKVLSDIVLAKIEDIENQRKK